MNHYENKIDPIGESMEKEPQDLSIMERIHNHIMLRNTYIDIVKKQIEFLDEIIKGNQTYSDNVSMIDNLKNLSQRMKNALKGLDSANGEIDGFIESNFKD